MTISTTTAGASIRYTTDGSTPSSTVGTVYSGPVSVSSSMTLKAIAYASGMTSSSVTTATYTITAAVTGAGTSTGSVAVIGGATPWYNSAWTNRKAVTIDHTEVSGNLANFPLLFSVTDANLKTVANGGQVGRSDGADVLFTAADGVTKLDHELDSYNSSTGQVSAWVRLPAISATTDTVIYVYYGNASAPDQQNRAGVWDSNYKLVWHLGDGTVVNPRDSTGNGSDGVSYGAGGVAGKIAGGAAGVIEAVANNLVTGDQSRTLECWFKIRGNLGSDQVICGMGYDTGTGTMFTLMYRAAGSLLSLDAKGIAQSFAWTYDGNWHHLAATYTSGSGLQNAGVYLDGVKQTTNGGSGTLVAQFPSYFDVEHSPGYPWNDMAGTVDEFRVSSTARSASWIAAEYNNQNSPSTFLKLGSQEPGNSSQVAAPASPVAPPASPVAPPAIAPPGGSYSSAQSVTISTATAGASIRYTTDGTTPSSTVGIAYNGPISVSSSMTLKAIAYAGGMTDSAVTSAAYLITAAITGNVPVTGGGTAWYNSSWTHRKAITVDHTKVAGSGNLINFPMLFSVTDANLKTIANGGQVGRSDGADVLFTAADGVTKLDHELEGYNGSAGQVTAWVRLPAVSSTTDTVIYVYYGNAVASDQQNKTAAWDSNYKLVWHLGNGTTLSGADSTTSNAKGVVYGVAGAGKIAGGAAGVVEGVGIGLVSADQTRTAECWFKITGNTGADQVICGMGYDSGTGSIFSLMYRAAGSTLSLDAKGIARSFPWRYDSNWHHLAATYTSGSGLQNAVVYLDGVPQTTTGGTGALATRYATYFDVQHSPAYPINDMTGVVDEFRISNIARSAAWIATEYNNQNSPSTFLNLASQE